MTPDERLAVAPVREDDRLAGDIDGLGLAARFREEDAGAVLQFFEEFEHRIPVPSSFSARREAPFR